MHVTHKVDVLTEFKASFSSVPESASVPNIVLSTKEVRVNKIHILS